MKYPSSPPAPPSRRRSPRSTPSSSSMSSSPSSSSSHCSQTPLHQSASPMSTIPFSWERTPGIPKNPAKKSLNSRPVPNRLPLPPLRSESFPRKKRSEVKNLTDEFDPFAVALVECAKDPAPSQQMELWMNRRAKPDPNPNPNRFGFGLGFIQALDLYGSCKASCSVTESTIEIPRVGQRVAAYRVLKN